MVRCIPVTFVTSNDGEDGRKILGLSTVWTVYQRADRQVGSISWHCLVLKCLQLFTSSLSGSTAHSLLALLPTKKLFLSTTKYEEINGVIKLPLRRRCRNPEESYRATTTLENQIPTPNPLESLILERRVLTLRLL